MTPPTCNSMSHHVDEHYVMHCMKDKVRAEEAVCYLMTQLCADTSLPVGLGIACAMDVQSRVRLQVLLCSR